MHGLETQEKQKKHQSYMPRVSGDGGGDRRGEPTKPKGLLTLHYFTSFSVFARLKNPCPRTSIPKPDECAPPFDYRHELNLTQNLADFKVSHSS